MRVLDGVEVHDLVAQLAAIVVVQVRGVGLRDAVGIGEEGAPVDQVGGVANGLGASRAQRRRDRVAQRHQLVAPVEILRVAGKATESIRRNPGSCSGSRPVSDFCAPCSRWPTRWRASFLNRFPLRAGRPIALACSA